MFTSLAQVVPIELQLEILQIVATRGRAHVFQDEEEEFCSREVTFGASSEERLRREEESVRRRAETQETLRRCSEVCWSWKHLVTPLLYAHPIIHNPSTLFPFLKTLSLSSPSSSNKPTSSSAPPLAHHLRSLTILPLPAPHKAPAHPRFLTDILKLLSIPSPSSPSTLPSSYPHLTHLSLPPTILSSATPFEIPGGSSRLWSHLSLLAPHLESLSGLSMRRTLTSSGHTRYLNDFLSRCSRLRRLEVQVETPYSAYGDHRMEGLPGTLRELKVVFPTSSGSGSGSGSGGGGRGGGTARNNLQPLLSSLSSLMELEDLTIRGLDVREEVEEWVVGDERVTVREGVRRVLGLGLTKEEGGEEGGRVEGLKRLRLEEMVLDAGVGREGWVEGLSVLGRV